MPSLDDLILACTGGPTVNEGQIDFFQSGGAAGVTLNELRYAFAASRIVAESADPSMSDVWFAYLRGLGYEGSLNDMLWEYWADCPTPVIESYLGFNGTTTIMDTGIEIDVNKNTVIGCQLRPSSLPDGVTINNRTIFGVDNNFYTNINYVVSNGNILFRHSLFGIQGNHPQLQHPKADTVYTTSLAYPADAISGTGVGTLRVNQEPDLARSGTTAPIATRTLKLGTRTGDGGNFFHGLLADFFVAEDGVVVHHWPLDEGSGTVANDIVGTANGVITDPEWVTP